VRTAPRYRRAKPGEFGPGDGVHPAPKREEKGKKRKRKTRAPATTSLLS
jgi:hypothetical protein